MKKISLGILLTALLFFLALWRFNHLGSRPIEVNQFSQLNKVEIYIGFLSMMSVGYLLYPEVSKEMALMLKPSSRNREIIFRDSFFLESKTIQEAIKNYDGPTRLFWESSHYAFGEPEARVALALNGGTLSMEAGVVRVSVPVSWPQYSFPADKKRATVLIKNPPIRIQEGLFWVLEREGWIFPYTAVWESEIQ